jgi:hypothetical protein
MCFLHFDSSFVRNLRIYTIFTCRNLGYHVLPFWVILCYYTYIMSGKCSCGNGGDMVLLSFLDLR